MTLKHWPYMYPVGSPDSASGKGRFLVGDSESKNLLDKLRPRQDEQHIIVLRDFKTREVFIFFDPPEKRSPCEPLDMDGMQDGYLMDGIRFIKEAEAVAFHNGMGYDQPAFVKCFGPFAKFDCWEARAEGSEYYDVFPFRYMDTYVVSTLLNPDRKPPPQAYAIGQGNVGPHSIAAHGIRINRFKPEHEDWTVLTDAMVHRCVEDTEIGSDLLRWLMMGEWKEAMQRPNKRTGKDIRCAYQQELRMGYEMAMQSNRGVRLDTKWCMDTWRELQSEIKKTEEAFRPHMPQRICKKVIKFEQWCKVVDQMWEWQHQNSSDIPKVREWLARDKMQTAARYAKVTHGSDLSTQWKLTTAKGDYTTHLKKVFPEMSGNINDKKDALVVGPFTPVRWEDIPLGNRDTVKQVLHSYGWLGVNYNDTETEYIEEHGDPEFPWSGKIDEDSIEAWKSRGEIPEWAEQIAKWYIYNSRSNQILNAKDVEHRKAFGVWPKAGCRGLMAQARCEALAGMTAVEYFDRMGEWPEDLDEDWRVPAVCIPIATNTFRARHKVVVNIPARGLYPLRRAFIAGKGKLIMGIDGAGLELRMLSHFMNDPKYEEILLSGDIHSHNQELAGLPTRDQAKTWIYALLYGSGDANLARCLGMTLAEVKAARERFMLGLPTLDKLMQGVEAAAAAYGYMLAVDGRRGYIRRRSGELATHTALNVLLQMTGSICMKWGLYDAIPELEELYGEVPLLIFMHDEYQLEIPEEDVIWKEYKILGYSSEKEAWKAEEKRSLITEEGQWSAPIKLGWDEDNKALLCKRAWCKAGAILSRTFTTSGEALGIRTPLAGEYKVGHDWHETH